MDTPTLVSIGLATAPGVIMARGKVALALNDMVTQGKVRTIPAPEGTPQLQKVNHIKYELTG